MIVSPGKNSPSGSLELFKEAVPKVIRVAVLFDPAIPTVVVEVKEVLPAAVRALRLTLQPWEIRTADDFERVFAARNKERPDGFYVPAAGPLINNNQKRIADLAARNRLPTISDVNQFAEEGGLMVYGPDRVALFRRAATHVDKILKGAKPADIPVEQPTKFEFIVNLKAAKQIGLTIPPNVLARADKVIR